MTRVRLPDRRGSNTMRPFGERRPTAAGTFTSWSPCRQRGLARILVALATVLALSGVDRAVAGSIAGPVIDVHSINDNVLVFVTDFYGNYAPPPCNTSRGFAFDTRTQGGRNKLAIALAAKNSGHHLGIGGSGVCDVLPNAESVSDLWEGLP